MHYHYFLVTWTCCCCSTWVSYKCGEHTANFFFIKCLFFHLIFSFHLFFWVLHLSGIALSIIWLELDLYISQLIFSTNISILHILISAYGIDFEARKAALYAYFIIFLNSGKLRGVWWHIFKFGTIWSFGTITAFYLSYDFSMTIYWKGSVILIFSLSLSHCSCKKHHVENPYVPVQTYLF